MRSIRKRWLVAASVVVACSQFVFLSIGSSSIGTLVYKLIIVFLMPIDQKVIPTLWATKEGWPLPTLFGSLLYVGFSSAIMFLALIGIRALFRKIKEEPNQPPEPTAPSGRGSS